MRLAAHTAANALAWAVFVLLIGVAVLIADRLGFVGLILLGGITWLVCLRAELDNDAPTWGAHVFRAQMERSRSPEQRAARLDERRAFLSPLRFYGRCGMVLTAVGILGVLIGVAIR